MRYGISAGFDEDNRYFVSGQTGFLRRTKFAILSTLLAGHDNGNEYFSFSRMSSAAGAAFISHEWQPRSTNSAGDGTVSFGAMMGAPILVSTFFASSAPGYAIFERNDVTTEHSVSLLTEENRCQ